MKCVFSLFMIGFLLFSTGGASHCRILCLWRKAAIAAGHLSLWGNRISNCPLILHFQSSWLAQAQDWHPLGGFCRFVLFSLCNFCFFVTNELFLTEKLCFPLAGKVCSETVWSRTWPCHTIFRLQEPQNGNKHPNYFILTELDLGL